MRILKHYVENKALFDNQNKVNDNRYIEVLYCKVSRNIQKQQTKKLFSLMSNLQTFYHFQQDFQKLGQHTGGKLLIHGTKRRRDNALQGLKLPCRISQ